MSSSSSSDSDRSGYTSEDFSQSRDILDFDNFFGRLQHVDANTIPPDEECPICRIPYAVSLAERRNEGAEHLDIQRFQTLKALPFHYCNLHDDIDHPVRLPCAAGHIVGRDCLMNWASRRRGNTCPLDRETLFRRRSHYSRTRDIHDQRRFDQGVREISVMPIRDFLRHFRNLTENDTIRVRAMSMREGLAPLIFRVVYHRAGFRGSHPTFPSPSISGMETLLSSQQAPRFRRVVRRFVRDEPLGENGQYPRYIRELLNPVLPHLFVLLYRLANHFHAHTIGAYQLARIMRDRVRRFFSDFSDLIMEEQTMVPIALLTIDLWIMQNLLVTELGRDTNQPVYRSDYVGEDSPRSEDQASVGDVDVGYADGPGWNRHRSLRFSRPPTLTAASSTWHAHAHIEPPRAMDWIDYERTGPRHGSSGPEVVHIPDHVSPTRRYNFVPEEVHYIPVTSRESTGPTSQNADGCAKGTTSEEATIGLCQRLCTG